MLTRLSALLLMGATLCSAGDALQRSLEKTLARWQTTLQLQDWQIFIKPVHIDDLPEGTLASSKWDGDLRRGYIAVLYPSDYHEASVRHKTVEIIGKARMLDIEDSILHELLHLRLREMEMLFYEAYSANGEKGGDDAAQTASDLILQYHVGRERAVEEMVVVRLTKALLMKGQSKP